MAVVVLGDLVNTTYRYTPEEKAEGVVGGEIKYITHFPISKTLVHA